MPDVILPRPAQTTCDSPSFVSSCEMSTINTCCVRLLRLAVMTSSALPYLAGFSLHTANLSTSGCALMTHKKCSYERALCVWLTRAGFSLHCQPEHFCICIDDPQEVQL
ncbi:TPA: hypothetical protein ACH3X3_003878 [Trebouxia sp. C0006]